MRLWGITPLFLQYGGVGLLLMERTGLMLYYQEMNKRKINAKTKTRGSLIHFGQNIVRCFVMALMVLFPHQWLFAAGPAPVELGSAAHFVILSGAAIATAGGGIIDGDVGASPIAGSAIGITTAQVNGIIYAVDNSGPPGSVVDPALLITAKNDLTTAYNDAAGRANADMQDPGSGNVGGMVLGPGLYKFTSSAEITGGNLTLTGKVNDVWIFQIGSTLTVGAGMHVILDGGAQARNVFWQVGISATILSTATFKGTILASQSITLYDGSTMEGRALAIAAAVTFNGQRGSLPIPEAPRFISIVVSNSVSATVVLITTPHFLLTLETCPDLLLTNWMTLATDTPISNLWTNTDYTATASVTQRFYRAFITP